jgi:hypothetical protein
VIVLTVGRFERCELDCTSAVHPKCCCAFSIAGQLLKRGSQGLLFCCYFRKEEYGSMRVHIDRERLDGNAIAFVLIILLIVIAFAY